MGLTPKQWALRGVLANFTYALFPFLSFFFLSLNMVVDVKGFIDDSHSFFDLRILLLENYPKAILTYVQILYSLEYSL